MSEQATWFCAQCGSEDIHHDATVQWDAEVQDWSVVDVHDGTWCNECRGSDPEDVGKPRFGNMSEPELARDLMHGGGA